MGKMFIILGKSNSGKDTIYRKLLEMTDLTRYVGYTTRPKRSEEVEGKEYHFVSKEQMEKMEHEGLVIERRDYNTVHGVWSYFTAYDDKVDLSNNDYLYIGTLESYSQIRDKVGSEYIVPIYVEVENGQRLLRALKREMEQDKPRYAEMCRRFLADEEDFSEDNLKKTGITKRYNNEDLDKCLSEITEDINRFRK